MTHIAILLAMGSDSFDDLVQSAALAELATGPMRILELGARLRRSGVLAHLQGLDDEQLALELDEILLSCDGIWTTDDGIVASTAALLNGANFSHHMTSSELERGVLAAVPDLAVLDFDIAGSLGLEGGGELKFSFEDGPGLNEHGFFVGPPGWLGEIRAPGTVVVSRSGTIVSLHTVAALGRGDAEEEALRQAFDHHHVEGILDEPAEIVLNALCRNSSLFRTPVVPVSELFERAGLECRGAWVARHGELAKPPGVIYRERLLDDLSEEYDFDRCCAAALEEVLVDWMNFVLRQTAPAHARDTARALTHGGVAPAFAEYVLGDDDLGSELLDKFATHFVSLGGRFPAPGHYLRALNAERNGRATDAERELRAAIAADSGFDAALLELSWYAADRGDAREALSLLRRSGALESDPEVEYLKSRLGVPVIGVGRNDPCPCGSGRKFKTCCINGRRPTLEERADWLCHKIMLFSFRIQNRWRLEELLDVATGVIDADATGPLIPVLAVLAAFDRDGLEEFIAYRGELLAEDELALVRAWLDVRPSLWQVVTVDPRSSVELFDTRTGTSIVVADRSASQSLHDGDYVFAHIVPAGSSWLFTGEIVLVPLAHRESLLDLLGAEGETQDLAAWVGRLFAPIMLANYEGEDMVMCRAVLAPATTSWDDLSDTLDRLFGESEDGRWTESVAIKGSSVVRCFLRRELETLVVETNSVERFERILQVLGEEVADLEIIEEVRTDLSSTSELAARADRDLKASTDEDLPAEVLQALRDLMREKEDAWLDESIPALRGLTPRQAAADPTRREDLAALLNEFDRRGAVPSQAVTFDVSRLRQQLGLFNS
jgi:hypothetical protein